ncbi:hypothetical protein [Pectobacterium peruviense]|uniref:hypothetical protein n=1 Tax=Pectobacterium peruviense TaxID=2066479 RepID=UPI000DE23C0E|nr:hypothetical protein [Pectobacterium peruviense]
MMPISRMVRPLLFLMLTFFIIPAKINLFSIEITTPYIAIFPFLFLYLFNIIYAPPSKREFFILFSFLIALCYSLIIILLYGAVEWFVLKLVLIGFALFVSSMQIVRLYFKIYGADAEKILVNDLIFIGVMNAFIAILMLLSPKVSDFFYNFISTNENNITHLQQGYRSSGLFYAGASILSVFNAMVFLLCVFRFANNSSRNNMKNYMLGIICSATLLLGTFISGRLGIILIIGVIVAVFFIPNSPVSFRKMLFIIFSVLCISMATILIVVPWEQITGIAGWALEIFINMYKSGKIESGSTGLLFDTMYFLPKNPIDMFFGMGTFGRGDNVEYINSDVGYVLMIFFGGFIAIPILFLPYVACFIFAKTLKDKNIKYIVCFVLFFILIGNFKDVYLYGINGVTQVLFILVAVFIIKGKYANIDSDS